MRLAQVANSRPLDFSAELIHTSIVLRVEMRMHLFRILLQSGDINDLTGFF